MKATNSNTENCTEKPVLSTLRNLDIGQSATFPANRASYIKSACTSFGFEWNKKFVTTTDRKLRTITATRIA